MKSRNSIIIVLIFGISALLLGCTPGDNPFPYIRGSVTVVNVADWDNLELGVFYDSSGDLTTNFELGETDYVYRATYWVVNDGTTIYSLTPETEAGTTISPTSGVNGTFNVDFDPAGSTSGFYYPIAWIDEDADGLLDLVDDTDEADQILNSEFSRTPRYDEGGRYTVRFYNTTDYGYKFDAYNNPAIELDAVDQSAFSFNMTPMTSGW